MSSLVFSRRRLLATSVGLVTVSALPLFAACSQAPAPPTPAPSAAPTSAPASQATATAAPQATTAPATNGQPVTVVLHWWLEDPQNTFWGPTIANFEKAHPDIKIEKQWFPRNDMHTKELALAATGQIGDVVRINVAPLVSELQLKGVVQALDNYIKSDKSWSENDQPQFWPANIATYTIKGQQWGFPIVGHPGAIEYFYNIDVLTKNGAPLPPADMDKLTFDYTKWKQSDFLASLAKAQVVGSDGRVSTYGILPSLGGEGTVAVLRSFGGNYYSDDGTKCLINSNESVQGLQFLSDYWNKYKDAVPYDPNVDWTKFFPTGRTTFCVLTAVAGTVTNLVKDKFKWGLAPPPLGPIGKPATQVSSDGIGMSKITKHPEQAWEVMKMCLSKEFGIGRHLAGLGSPGSRYDVWTDPMFKKAEPLLATIIYDNLINPKTAPPLMPWSHPANGRFFESDNAMTNILGDIWLGKKTPKQAADEAQSTVQAILDKPPA
ncbi:MAG TPA: extracellular solute-binding protein [Chloroflexota bacterium]|nr:extracellular solute-binding protein [Chloroflexota bacterium]